MARLTLGVKVSVYSIFVYTLWLGQGQTPRERVLMEPTSCSSNGAYYQPRY